MPGEKLRFQQSEGSFGMKQPCPTDGKVFILHNYCLDIIPVRTPFNY